MTGSYRGLGPVLRLGYRRTLLNLYLCALAVSSSLHPAGESRHTRRGSCSRNAGCLASRSRVVVLFVDYPAKISTGIKISSSGAVGRLGGEMGLLVPGAGYGDACGHDSSVGHERRRFFVQQLFQAESRRTARKRLFVIVAEEGNDVIRKHL
ncbi:hypothetical protein CALVIDRAFT_525256 [Calocera viscosa TUFC12733]|uniref:Uncharacterized protein n=1 Tax=Calocera viscosa (strain TUFC12733) TaxID=1330018 RepID=A0A167QF95_CALVF|nr:hypothetical protein CALVIDRAFT_525256 [Calocera viscosa TUFC12733]